MVRKTKKQKIRHQKRLEKAAVQESQKRFSESEKDTLIRFNIYPTSQYKFNSSIESFEITKFLGFNFYKKLDSIGGLYHPSLNSMEREVEIFREDVAKEQPKYIILDILGMWRGWRHNLREELSDITTHLTKKERFFLREANYSK